MCRLRDRWPTVICQTRTQSKLCSVPCTEVRTLVGWYMETNHCARATVERAKFVSSTVPTENILYGSMFRKRNVTSKASPDGCTATVLPLLALFIPHAECNVNEPVYADCTTQSFANLGSIGPSYSFIYLTQRRDYLEFPRVASLFPGSFQRGSFQKLRPFRRWHLRNRSIKAFPHSLFKRFLPEKCQSVVCR